MLDRDFFEFLEYELTKAFANADEEKIRHFWCDGFLLSFDEHNVKKLINDNRQIILTTFIGKNGQDNYTMTLNFGNKALRKVLNNLTLVDCIPDITKNDWYKIDTTQKTIIINLL